MDMISLIWADDKIAQPILSNGVGLGDLIKDISSQMAIGPEIDAQRLDKQRL